MTECLPPEPSPENPTAKRLREHLQSSSIIAARIYRNLLILLHTRGHITIDTIHEQARMMLDPGETSTLPDEEDPD